MYLITTKSGKVHVCSYWMPVFVHHRGDSYSVEIRYLINDQDHEYQSIDIMDLDKIEEVER